ncbi:MAG: hypothetical protein Q8K00_05400 [Syntrophales bacterium]|nr:hypothetical protein [Syntrophales bacterium]
MKQDMQADEAQEKVPCYNIGIRYRHAITIMMVKNFANSFRKAEAALQVFILAINAIGLVMGRAS